MITTDTENGRIEAHAYGKLTLADLKTLEACSTFDGMHGSDLLLDLRNLGGISLDAIIEEWKFAHKHAKDFRRIAVVSDDQLVGWGACLSQLFVAAEICTFTSEQAAEDWLKNT